MANNWNPGVYDAYFSMYGKPGENQFTKDNPGANNQITSANKSLYGYGTFNLSNLAVTGQMYGHGISNTIIKYSGGYCYKTLRYLTIQGVQGATPFNVGSRGDLSSTKLVDLTVNISFRPGQPSFTRNCIFQRTIAGGIANDPNHGNIFANCTFVDCQLYTNPMMIYMACKLPLFDRCTFDLENTFFAGYRQPRAFSNCLFKLGNESVATPLTGTTPVELKANLIARFASAGLPLNANQQNIINDNYFFSNDSINESSEVIAGSDIDIWSMSKGVYLGHTLPVKTDAIPITKLITPKSFNNVQGIASDGIIVDDNLLTLDASVDGNKQANYLKQSTIIPMHNAIQMKSINIFNNLPADLGILASTSGLLQEVTTLEEGFNYVVRSADDNEAIIIYNGANYSSVKGNNNYIFRSVIGQSNITIVSGKPIILKVLDLACLPTIDVRSTFRYNAYDIQSDKLKRGYWYIVSPKDPTNPNGSVVYNGNTYPLYASFLATDVNICTLTGNCQLDEVFIDDETKNPFVTLVTSDMRTVLKSPFSLNGIGELNDPLFVTKIKKGTDNKPIGSTHSEFSYWVNSGGKTSPIMGTVFQFRIGISTQN